MLIGVPRETAAGETRVAATPETTKKLKAQGHTIRVESGAGVAASVIDDGLRRGRRRDHRPRRRVRLRPRPQGALAERRRAAP